MKAKRPIYVLDTNILIDYPDIIPGSGSKKPKNPTIDLAGAHLVVPSAVIRELSSFKREKSDRGKAARVVLRRLRNLSKEGRGGHWDSYTMGSPMQLFKNGMTFSILPVHKNFKDSLPFAPDENDMDGQIILAAISASYIAEGRKNDGSNEVGSVNDFVPCAYSGREVIILTNDNGLAIRAHERGIATDRFGYDCPAPYTGRRDLEVPAELFSKMFLEKKVPREEFERLMPDEPPLVANEFIIMTPKNLSECTYFDPRHNPSFANIGRYDRYEDALVPLKFVRSFPVKPLTVGQALYAEALADPSIAAVICTGPAGSGKTYMVTIYGYISILAGLYMGISVVPCENTSKLGALPGGLNSKMDPQVQPFKNALRNYLYKKGFAQPKKKTSVVAKLVDEEIDKDLEVQESDEAEKSSTENAETTEASENSKAKPKRKTRHRTKESRNQHKKSLKVVLDEKVEDIWRDCFSNIPIEVARGQDFNDQIAIYDEFQDQNASQADTLIKRISGDHGKIVITGDIEQIHSPYLDENNNGIVYASEILYDSPMVARVSFTEDDVVRHPLVKMIAERQKKAKTQKEEI